MTTLDVSRRYASRSLSVRCLSGLVFVISGLVDGTPHTFAADAKPVKPATVAEAAKVIDLATFPLLKDAEKPPIRRLAGLSYQAKGTVKDAFEFQKAKLIGLKFKELPNGYSSEQAASGTFAREGFLVSVSVFDGGKPEMVNVMVSSHGNIDTAKLPVPKGAKSLYAMPVSAMFVTEAPVKETAQEVRKLLMAQGWQPYGTADESQFFKQNAVRLQARVSTAPAQGGKTVIDYTSELMSADLPAPAELIDAQYSDSTKQLLFDTKQSPDEIVKFYQETLGKAGWKPTLEKLTKSGFKEFMIFRNPQKDLLNLETHTVDDFLRVTLDHQTAAEVEELERLAKLAQEKKAKAAAEARDKPAEKLAILLPADAREIETGKGSIEFKLAAGKGKEAAETLRKKFRKEGWKETEAAFEEMAGTVILNRKDGAMLTILYVDPGIIPAEITISASQIELDVTRPEKD